jgi:hypothetical protein
MWTPISVRLTKDHIFVANGSAVKKYNLWSKFVQCYPMEKIHFSIGCAPQTVGQRAKRDTYFERTPIALQLVLVSIF